MKAIKIILAPFASLKVTIVLLLLCMLLVFAGTTAQREMGVQDVQRQFFHSWVAWIQWHFFQPAPAPPTGNIISVDTAANSITIAGVSRLHAKGQSADSDMREDKTETVTTYKLTDKTKISLNGAHTLAAIRQQLDLDAQNRKQLKSNDPRLATKPGISTCAEFNADKTLSAVKDPQHYISGSFPMPGGLMLLTAILVNLLAAHTLRFKFRLKRIGILMIHSGLIMLIGGEVSTYLLAVESQMRIDAPRKEFDTRSASDEIHTKTNYAEDIRYAELAIVDHSPADHDNVSIISQTRLKAAAGGPAIHDPANLPFDVKVLKWYENSRPPNTTEEEARIEPHLANLGTAKDFSILNLPKVGGVGGEASETDIPSAVVEFIGKDGKSLGIYFVSLMFDRSFINAPTYRGQTVEIMENGKLAKTYAIDLRFPRYYKPYTVTLKQFTHEVIPGTDTARDYASTIQLVAPEKHVDREVRIWMNHPLRYAGDTFYQQSFSRDDNTTMLQVVHNDWFWLPYFACAWGGAGLIIHFGITLISFLRRRLAPTPGTVGAMGLQTSRPPPIPGAKRMPPPLRPTREADRYTLKPEPAWKVLGIPVAVVVLAAAYVITQLFNSGPNVPAASKTITLGLGGDKGATATYPVDPAAPISLDNTPTTLDALPVGSRINLTLSPEGTTVKAVNADSTNKAANPPKLDDKAVTGPLVGVDANTEPFNLDSFGKIPMFIDGRTQPLDSVARNFLGIVNGGHTEYTDAKGKKRQAIEWLADVMTRSHHWADDKVIVIDYPELKRNLGLDEDEKRFSWSDLKLDDPKAFKEFEDQAHMARLVPDKERDDFQSAILQLEQHIGIYWRLLQVDGVGFQMSRLNDRNLGANSRAELFKAMAKERPELFDKNGEPIWTEENKPKIFALIKTFDRSKLTKNARNFMDAEGMLAVLLNNGEESSGLFLIPPSKAGDEDHIKQLRVAKRDIERKIKQLAPRWPMPGWEGEIESPATLKQIYELQAKMRPIETELAPCEWQPLLSLWYKPQTARDAAAPGFNEQEWKASLWYTPVPPSEAATQFLKLAKDYADDRPTDFNLDLINYHRLTATLPGTETRSVTYEVFFDRFAPFYICEIFYVLIFIIACVSWLFWGKSFTRMAFWLMLLTLLVHTFGILSRIYISGRPPVTTLYSASVFIGWGVVVFSVLIERIYKNGISLMAGSVVGFISLLVAAAFASGDGDTMKQLQAVLDTNIWLATHVVCVTLGYTATVLAGVLSIIYIVINIITSSFHRQIDRIVSEKILKEVARMIYGIVCFAMLFSFVGTILGGIWADQSWGRFWGWDPKENGAVLVVLWNAIILHARWSGIVRERGVAMLAVLGNLVVGWSMVGTNLLGIGLHSYGFMSGAQTMLNIWYGVNFSFCLAGFVPPIFFRPSSIPLANRA